MNPLVKFADLLINAEHVAEQRSTRAALLPTNVCLPLVWSEAQRIARWMPQIEDEMFGEYPDNKTKGEESV